MFVCWEEGKIFFKSLEFYLYRENGSLYFRTLGVLSRYFVSAGKGVSIQLY